MANHQISVLATWMEFVASTTGKKTAFAIA